MTTTDSCDECGRSFALVPDSEIERHRESTGFGPHNERIRRFCSVACRAHYLDVDPVLEATQQATLTAFDPSVDDPASRIAWSR